MLCLDKHTGWACYENGEAFYFGAGTTKATELYTLDQIEQKARAKGALRLIGPVSGDTWHNYRAVTGSSGAPFFALEPDLLDPGLGLLGFSEIASYSSSIVELEALKFGQTRQPASFAQLDWDSLDLSNFDSELESLWQLSLVAFKNNFLYQPIALAEFKALYQPMQQYIDGNYVLMVRDKGELVGCLFCFADFLCRKKKRLVVKTIARKPGRRYGGLGETMLSMMLKKAREDGFEEAILALYKDDNVSSKLSERFLGRKIRSYGLFGRELSYEY